MNSRMSAHVTTRPHLSPTEQDRTGQDSHPLTSTAPSRAREESSGRRQFLAYLQAPAAVREAFDREQRRKIEADLALERNCAALDDPLALAVEARRRQVAAALGLDRPTAAVPAPWTRRWQKRALRPAPKPGQRAPYSRESDPLFALNLRDVWEQLTAEPIRGTVSTCPHPDHDDRWPSCAVRDRMFFCNSCGASGSIVDLGALLYGLEPRGSSFFEIRNRLLADLGMSEEVAA